MKGNVFVVACTFLLLFIVTVHGQLYKHSYRNRPFSTYPTSWFLQKLDHFNGADLRTWKQVSVLSLTSGLIVV